MGAVTLSREGAAQGAIAALNAGVDLILVSYDPDQYFPVMHALLAADRAGGSAGGSARAERRTAAPRRGTLSRHQLRTFRVKSNRRSPSPQSLIRP